MKIPGGRVSPVSSPRGIYLGQRRKAKRIMRITQASQLGIERVKRPLFFFLFVVEDFFLGEDVLLPEEVVRDVLGVDEDDLGADDLWGKFPALVVPEEVRDDEFPPLFEVEYFSAQ